MQYYSTNNPATRESLETAVVKGLAADRGLYMPTSIRPLPQEFFDNIQDMSLQEISFRVAECFFGEDIPAEDLRQIVYDTMSFPIPAVKVTDNIYSLELFHGPTLAFKDVGARFMARLLGYFNKKQGGDRLVNRRTKLEQNQTCLDYAEQEGGRPKVNVLVATSGDTGSAVANGFLGVPGIHVYVLYPQGKVSPIQECQFTTLGQNITAIEVDGVFDDCQAMVKSAFMDEELNLHMKLTSANSINVARFLPQSFYYFWAYAQLKKQGIAVNGAPSAVAPKLVACVPSGNFGNICSALFGRRMGLPIDRFIAANNANDIFYNYLQTGQYNPRPSTATIANAMDVGDPSNFARILDLYGHSHEAIIEHISGATSTDEQIASTMRQCLSETGYQLDPHGACGYQALQDGLRPGEVGFFLETAHPAKFKQVVDDICHTDVEIPARLAAFMQGQKQSVPMPNDFQAFKQFLLER